MKKTKDRLLRLDKNPEHLGGIYVALTPEEEAALKEFHGGELEKITSSVYMIPLKFIDPSRITAYECGKCNREFIESPKTKVEMRYRGVISCGKFETSVMYFCKHCEDTLLYGGHSDNPEIIPKQFITYDETGEFILPTEKSIEDLFEKIEKQAKDGETRGAELDVILHWCEKANYTIETERITSLEDTFKTNYKKIIRNDLSRAINGIKEMSYIFGCAASIDDDVNHLEGSGVLDNLEIVDKALELGIVPKDRILKIDMLKILLLCQGIPKARIELYREKQQEIDIEIEKEEKREENSTKKINKFLNKAGLTLDAIATAKKTYWI